jgi:O-antigen biosynthesis protein
MTDCDIILTVYNNIELTRNCLESVARHFRPGDRLTIIDNGSDPATRTFLADFAAASRNVPTEIVRLETNQGFLKAANEGLRRSTKAAVCLLSNDTVVTAGWLDRMCGLMELNPRMGILNPMSTTFGMYPKPGQTAEDCAREIAHLSGRYAESASCVGFCMLIKKEVIAAIGYLDGIYADGYFEDTDFCRRATAAGFICAIAKDAYVWHREHSTFGKGQREALFVKNRGIFEQRWGKPLRIVYAAAGRRYDGRRLIDETLRSARQGNWIWLIVPRDEKNKFSEVLIHGNIRLIGVGRFALRVYPWFLYLWKRKKPIDKVIIR